MGDEGKVLESRIRLDSGERDRVGCSANRREWDDRKLWFTTVIQPRLLRVLSRVTGDPGETDDRLLIPCVIDKALIAGAHGTEVIERLRVAHTVPRAASLLDEVREAVGGRLGFQEVGGHGRSVELRVQRGVSNADKRKRGPFRACPRDRSRREMNQDDGTMPPEQAAPQRRTDSGERRRHDDVLGALDQFADGLQSLTALYAQRQSLQTRLDELEQSLTARREAAEASERSVLTAKEEVERREQTLAQMQTELEGRAKAIEQDRAAIDEMTKAAAEAEARRAAAAEERETRWRTETASHEARRAEQESRASEQARQIEHARVELAANEASLAAEKQKLSDERSQILVTREELATREAAIVRDARRVADERKELESLRTEIARRHSALEASDTSSKALGETIARQDATLSQATGLISEYQSLWLNELAFGAVTTSERAALASEVAELEGIIEMLKDKLRSELAGNENASTENEAVQALLLQRDESIATLESTVSELNSRLADAVARAESSEAAATTIGSDADAAPRTSRVRSETAEETRRRRLRLLKQLVRTQANKVRKASDAIKRRMEQCDQVLSQRAELVQLRERVIEEQQRASRQRAGSRAAVTTLCIVAVIGMLGGLSWALAHQIAPATFIAESAVKADGRGRELNAAELDEWNRYHESLLKDPRFHEAAADKFKRLGVASLSAPPLVAAMVTSNLTHDGDVPGEMVLRLKGQGADRTRRDLETMTSALMTFANSAQQQRIDGGMTAVSRPAAAGDQPIDNVRTVYALGMLGAATCVFGILGLTLWKRLAGAKTAFEQDSNLAAALDTSRWADPSKA